ncbi:hypothetical protein F4859DRAFT_471485 [Xylaria cf. heliscus]|nr:hypothetical protein F4859DRAFT_471485 [Xylaria cf. heliscus]
MSSIKNVVLAGATGNLGPAILDQLLKAGFQVTVLTRQSSTHELPASAKVTPVDYDSVESLTAALQGQDAVVSTLGMAALSKESNLLQASIKAGVKRFIPSEFGSDTTNPKSAGLPVFKAKVAAHKELAKEAADGNITYTTIINGPFFDWCLKVGLILNIKEKSLSLYEGGVRPFSSTTLEGVGKAVAGVLKKPEETKNRAVYVSDAAPSLKQLKAIAEKITGTTWQAKDVSVENDILPSAFAELKKENPDHNKFVFPMLIAAIWGEGYGGHFQKLDNELLGVRQLTEAEIEAIVADTLAAATK